MMIRVIRFLNITIAAILAGVSFAIWKGFSPYYAQSPSSYIRHQQHMLLSLKVLMIALVVAAILITLTSAFLQKKDKSVFISLLIAAGFFIACLLITRFGNKPIDEVMLTWNPRAVPDNWTMLRDQWWQLHKMRTATELIALAIVTWTGVKKD